MYYSLVCVLALVGQAVGGAVNPLQWLEVMEVMARSKAMNRSPLPRDLNWQLLVESGSDLYKTEEVKVTDSCWRAMEQCSSKTMVTGKCKSTYSSLLMDLVRNDDDVNCVVNAKDYLADIEFYDTNPRDGKTCLGEWRERRSEYFQYSQAFTDYEWTALVGSADACFATADVYQVPSQSLKTELINSGVSRLVSFCKQGNNMETNRDCLGLPVICRDQRPDLEACRELPSNVRSLKQKLDLSRGKLDPNGDGFSTVTEVADLTVYKYDTDNSGCTTVDEWVYQWINSYGYTEEFGIAYFNGITGDGAVQCLNETAVDNLLGPDGVETSYLMNLFMSSIVGLCDRDPGLYETNKDCAMAADTCRNFFPENPSCKAFVDDCGPAKYSDCVNLLPLAGPCRADRDKAEVHMERHRVENIINDNRECKDPRETCKEEEAAKARVMRMFGRY